MLLATDFVVITIFILMVTQDQDALAIAAGIAAVLALGILGLTSALLAMQMAFLAFIWVPLFAAVGLGGSVSMIFGVPVPQAVMISIGFLVMHFGMMFGMALVV